LTPADALRPQLDRIQQRAFILGALFLLISAVGAAIDAKQFYRSYLLGYLFWIGIALGSFAIVMLHHMVGGRWGFAIRRLLESATRTIPVMLLLIVPLVAGIHSLYEWSHADVVARDPILRHKSAYLNTPFFVARTAIYFAIWLGLAYVLNRWSAEQDRTADPELVRKLQSVSGPGLILYGLTATFAAVDWAMSLEPHWFSTIYGAIFMVGQVLNALAFMTAIMVKMSRSGAGPMAGTLSQVQYHDLGNLLLAFVMLWAYLCFSQFLIIWSGNLPEEIPYYIRRKTGGWLALAIFLVVFHFMIPFVLLLSRDVKRKARRLWIIAAALVFMRFLDLIWQIGPAFSEHGFRLHWLDIVTPLGIGGIWVGTFVWQLKKRPLVPLHDTRLEGAGAHG
jgi:hypothetical protein